MLSHLRATFELDGVRLRAAGGEDEHDLQIGTVDGAASLRLPLTGPSEQATGELEVFGRSLSDDEQRVLRVVADQLSVALNTRRLTDRAADASALAQVDAVRTAMLRSVSHDLRTPLASIKAMVSGLREPDVEWSPQQVSDALAIVEAETDRLNRLVGNLLDASRLQTGELAVDVRPTPLVEAVEAAVGSIGCTMSEIDVQLPADIPLVAADPVLLERALANVLANAWRFNPHSASPVRVDAAALGNEVHLRIVDHGPGIARERRRQVLEPFQRLGDERTGDGVGLGLTIAQGFVAAMGGRLAFDDTPGGGLTVTIVLSPSIPTKGQPCPPS
jgi:two-component system sensor histidine kinase KdpD